MRCPFEFHLTHWLRWHHSLVPLLTIAVISLCSAARAQGGPPFKTDDPETPGNRHWEINFGWLGERSAGEGSYSVPDVDVNYGLGDRVQLKLELPIAIHEIRQLPGGSGQTKSATQARLEFGAGESLLGVKWRFYEHHAKSPRQLASEGEPAEPNFSLSTYPQLSLNNPTSSVERAVVTNGPQFLFPIEANARVGPIRIDGEAGYWFTNRDVPQSWIRGMIIGYEFTRSTEAYLEIYDQQDANRVDGVAKGREATLGLGGRHAMDKKRSVLLLLMGGRSFQRVAPDNMQPGWIAYVGVQILLGPK